jgi:tryptophanyl-tRNA synthetase
MSKSYGNTIDLADDAQTTTRKVRAMVTDPLKIRRNDPGRPEICPVFGLQALANPGRIEAIADDCRSGALGCVACKGELAEVMNAWLAPVRSRRAAFDRQRLAEIIAAGTEKARVVARATMRDVRRSMKL